MPFRRSDRGLPRIETRFQRGNDGIVHFSNLEIYSPKLRLSGAGSAFATAPSISSPAGARRNRAGADDPRRADRAAADRLLLDRPNDFARAARGTLAASAQRAGFDYRASGGSKLGPFTSNGRILLPKGGRTVIAIAALDAGGAHASGSLRSDPGGSAAG